MDGLGSFLGGIAQGAFGYFGAQLNASSQQAINAANLQQQMQIASGAQLPGLVRNAREAGINPLAVLGQSAPGGMAAVGTNPGAGLQAAGGGIAAALSGLQADELHQKALMKADIDIANARTLGNNAAIAGARDMWTLEAMQQYMHDYPGTPPPGMEQRSMSTMGAGWLDKFFHAPWNDPANSPAAQIYRRWPSSVLGSPLQ